MRVLRAILAIVVAVVAASAATTPAQAAQRQQAAQPKITRVTPMRVEVGQLLTIHGRGFKARKARNTVVFRGTGGRTAFAKPRRAGKRKLVVRVPASVSRLLAVRAGKQRATRVRLRVLAGRFSAFTPRRLSPVVVGYGSGGGPDPSKPLQVCNKGWDHDGDLVGNADELALGTDPCLRDSDGDGVEDGYEIQAAIDLNHYPETPPLPYPGKRPYPNALDPGDAKVDYDGDGLRLIEEYRLWVGYESDGVLRTGRPTARIPLQPHERLLYSDGLQVSLTPAPPAPGGLLGWVLDYDGDGRLSDGERDADGDGLGNWDELRGRFTEQWWTEVHAGSVVYEDFVQPLESPYPPEHGNFLDNADLPRGDAHVDPDMDGDGVPDGADDHDHDGIPNQYELRRPADWIVQSIAGFPAAANPWAYVHPFNPCKPFDSERCHTHQPLGYYDNDGVPPIGPIPPPGHPAGGPPTPAGP